MIMSDENNNDEKTAALRRWRRRAVALGAVLALVCRYLPADYQAPCEAIARICTGVIP